MKKTSRIAAVLVIVGTLFVGPASAGIVGSDRNNWSSSPGASFNSGLYVVAYNVSPRLASFLVNSGVLR